MSTTQAHPNTIKTAIYKVLEEGPVCRDAFDVEVMLTVSDITDEKEHCDPCTVHPVLKKMFQTNKVTAKVMEDDNEVFPLYIAYDLTDYGFELARVSNYSLTR